MEIKLKYIIISILVILFTIVNYFMINHLIATDGGKNISNQLILIYTIIVLFDCGLFLRIICIIIDYCEENWNKNINIKL